MTAITPDVISAILSGTTRVTRRTEIYERDATTLWLPTATTPRTISGSISVDYSRDERRSVDVTFDNADGVLKHDPNEFWYDKVIKAYRGVRYTRPDRKPRIALLWDDTSDLKKILRNLGYTDVDTFPEYFGPDPFGYPYLEKIKTYDIVCAGITTSTRSFYGAILGLAFDAGVNVFSYGDQLAASGSYTAPWYVSGTVVGTAITSPPIVKGTGNNIFREGWANWTDTHSMSGTLLTGITNQTISVATHLMGGTTLTYAVVAFENKSNNRWFHNNFKGSYNGAINRNLSQLTSLGLNWVNARDQILNWETQIGEFMIDDITEDNFPRHINVTGRDYTKKLLENNFTSATSFDKGASLDGTIKTIATNGGITKFRLGAGGIALNALASFDRTTARWASMKTICESHNVEIFFSADGYLVTRPFRDPVTSPAGITLSADHQIGNLVSYKKKSSSSRIYNVVVVTSENNDAASSGVVYFAVSRNTNPASPTSIDNIGYERTYNYSSPLLTSNEQCQTTADSLLKIMALEDFSLNFSSLVFPWMEGGDVLNFDDPRRGNNEPSRFLLTTFDLPLGLGPMSGSGKRVTIIGNADTAGILP